MLMVLLLLVVWEFFREWRFLFGRVMLCLLSGCMLFLEVLLFMVWICFWLGSFSCLWVLVGELLFCWWCEFGFFLGLCMGFSWSDLWVSCWFGRLLVCCICIGRDCDWCRVGGRSNCLLVGSWIVLFRIYFRCGMIFLCSCGSLCCFVRSWLLCSRGWWSCLWLDWGVGILRRC